MGNEDGYILLKEEIRELWGIFDAGYKHSNDRMLTDKLSAMSDRHNIGDDRDREMLADLSRCLDNGGFLLKEEKMFLINYSILLAGSRQPSLLSYLRDCSSILDLWPTGDAKKKTDFSSNTLRKEFLILFMRMYEVLGNTFLQRKGHLETHHGLELVRYLARYECRLHRVEFAAASEFFVTAELMIRHNERFSDIKPCIKVMRKLVWKIREGLTRYSMK